MIILVMISVVFCGCLAFALRPIDNAPTPINLIGFDGLGVVALFVLFVGLAAVQGINFAISGLLALGFFEIGRVLANRVLSRGQSNLRMVPFLTKRQVHERPFASESEAFFFALMGSGFSLAPMVLALSLSAFLGQSAPSISQFLLVLGTTIGAFNFFVLLPFPPLSGGVCAMIATRNFWPTLSVAFSVFMIAAFASAGIRSGSISLGILALAGLVSLFYKPNTTLTPMGQDAGLIGLAAYTFTLAAHFTAGWMLLTVFY